MDGGHAFLEEQLPEHVRAELGVLLRMAKLARKSEQVQSNIIGTSDILCVRHVSTDVRRTSSQRFSEGKTNVLQSANSACCVGPQVCKGCQRSRTHILELSGCRDQVYSMFVRVKDKRALTIAKR
eukprot:853894-Amphidinium_carterae.1